MTNRDHYVYRALDASGAVLYVGCSKRPRSRVAQHMNVDSSGRRREDGVMWFAKHVDSWRFTGPFERGEAYERERMAIASLQPIWNSHTRGAGTRAERIERYLAGQAMRQRKLPKDGDGIPAPVGIDDAVEALGGFFQITRDRAFYLLMVEGYLSEAERAVAPEEVAA